MYNMIVYNHIILVKYRYIYTLIEYQDIFLIGIDGDIAKFFKANIVIALLFLVALTIVARNN